MFVAGRWSLIFLELLRCSHSIYAILPRTRASLCSDGSTTYIWKLLERFDLLNVKSLSWSLCTITWDAAFALTFKIHLVHQMSTFQKSCDCLLLVFTYLDLPVLPSFSFFVPGHICTLSKLQILDWTVGSKCSGLLGGSFDTRLCCLLSQCSSFLGGSFCSVNKLTRQVTCFKERPFVGSEG